MFCANSILNAELIKDMCARLLACPLCSQPGFLTLDSLRAGLISVATRPLICPVCNEVLLGIDKLTIHLFSHTINLNGNTVESPKHVNVAASAASISINLQDTAFQEWNTSKSQTADIGKLPNDVTLNPPTIAESPKNSRSTKENVAILNSQVCVQDRNLSLKGLPQVAFLPDQNPDSERLHTFHELQENNGVILDSYKTSQEALPETMKLSYATRYCANDNAKPVGVLQNLIQTGHGNAQPFTEWVQYKQCEQRSSVKNAIPADASKSDGSVTATLERNDRQSTVDSTPATTENKTSKLSNFESFSNITPTSSNGSLERYNNDKNTRGSAATDNENQDENVKHEEILPYLRAFKVVTTKEKTERCNICGFHFPDYNILLLHKQLVHMIDEKDLNVIPENFLKNYSCHLCSKVFKMRGSLMVHMRVAHTGYNLGSLPKDGQVELILNENGYNCPTCGKKFKKEQHVIQHLKTHEAKQWECDVCSKMFTTKYFLKKHKRLHSGEMPYKCNICNKTFTFQQSYHKHRLYHKDDKPHMCATCGRSFKELSTLHNHERIHTGEKPFACETCGKCFRQRVSYLVHRRIHTGVMPYKCTMCGKSFRYKVSQRTHKCPAQQVASAQQAGNFDKKIPQLADSRQSNNEFYQGEKMNSSKESQSMLSILENEENKYVLVINTQGQHLLTRESDIGNTRQVADKEEKIEEYIEINSENKELKNIWNSDISNSPIFKRPIETSAMSRAVNEKESQEDTNDFFSMVMSPLENGLTSPTTEMQHLRVSSPVQKHDMLESYNFKSNSSDMQIGIVNGNMEENLNRDNNVTNTLQTINEESLKQLLYGIEEK